MLTPGPAAGRGKWRLLASRNSTSPSSNRMLSEGNVFQTIRKNGINKEFRKYGTPDGRSAEAAVAIAVYPGKQIGSMPYLPLLFHVVACSGHGYGGYGVLQFRPLLRRAGKIKRV